MLMLMLPMADDYAAMMTLAMMPCFSLRLRRHAGLRLRASAPPLMMALMLLMLFAEREPCRFAAILMPAPVKRYDTPRCFC